MKIRAIAIFFLVVLEALAMPATADRVDDLILDLKYGTSDVQRSAAVDLGWIGDQRAVPILIRALKDENE
jgi:HEAT repeat protein